MLHITTPADWLAAQAAGQLVDPSLHSEGFIHCSFPEQVLKPANERFAGRDDLCLLIIDQALVKAEVIVEDPYGSGIEFPHIYGPLNLDAVVGVVPFPRSPTGDFTTVPGFGNGQ